MDLRIINSWYFNIAKTCFVVVFVCGALFALKELFFPLDIGTGKNNTIVRVRESRVKSWFETPITVITEYYEPIRNRTHMVEMMLKKLNKNRNCHYDKKC